MRSQAGVGHRLLNVTVGGLGAAQAACRTIDGERHLPVHRLNVEFVFGVAGALDLNFHSGAWVEAKPNEAGESDKERRSFIVGLSYLLPE